MPKVAKRKEKTIKKTFYIEPVLENRLQLYVTNKGIKETLIFTQNLSDFLTNNNY